MFFLGYVRNELFRRRTRTILTMLGLGLGVALVVAISAISHGLDNAQKKALDPLSGIGTDLTVTRAAQTNNSGFGGGPFGGGSGGGGDSRDLLAANSSVITDLSKLGKPGQHFVHDFFLPGTQLTFPAAQAKQIAKLSGVAAVSEGLVLIAEHQEGTVPKIVATLKAGGQTFNIQRRITPPTAAEQLAIQKCIAKLQGSSGGNTAPAGPTGAGGFGQRNGRGQGGGGGFRAFGRGAFAKCLPARLRQFRTRFRTPVQTLRQVLDPPQTNITTEPYTIAGVETSNPSIGLVTPAQVIKGPLLLARRRPRGPRGTELRVEARTEGRLDAVPERHVLQGRRARPAAARRPDRRRVPAARPAAAARG